MKLNRKCVFRQNGRKIYRSELKLGREKDAIGQFLRAIKAEKGFALSYMHLANTYRKAENYQMAIDAYRMYLSNSDEKEYYRSVVEMELKDLLARNMAP